MDEFVKKMRTAADRAMAGRYGMDELSVAVGALGVVLGLVGGLVQARWLSWVSLAVVAYALWRAWSRDGVARRAELERFRGLTRRSGRAGATARKMWGERKEKAFGRCPTCGQILAVPRGKGRVRATCPKCGTKVIIKS